MRFKNGVSSLTIVRALSLTFLLLAPLSFTKAYCEVPPGETAGAQEASFRRELLEEKRKKDI